MSTRDSRPNTSTLAALGRTASGVAHDVDNALTAIVTHATLIRAGSHDAQAVAHAEAILRAARAASEVVERVRGALREAPSPTRRVQVDLRELVEDARVVVQARASARQVRLVCHAAAARVLGQPAELLQLVINLANNAVDASPPGAAVHVDVDAEAGEAIVRVRDRGPGIPAALRERVMEPFFTTKGAGGTGLGLALARSIAEGHGGVLALEPAVGGGTLATVVLPLAPPDAPAPAAMTDLSLSAVGTGARVLLVDDDDATREALSTLMEAAGLEVVAVRSASEALVRFHATRPDVVVTDLQLGGASGSTTDEDGGQLVVTLAALDARVPIVVASGVADASGAGRGQVWRSKVQAIFDKPISPGKLIARLRELVARRQALDGRREDGA